VSIGAFQAAIAATRLSISAKPAGNILAAVRKKFMNIDSSSNKINDLGLVLILPPSSEEDD
jgi:hypothetical protein